MQDLHANSSRVAQVYIGMDQRMWRASIASCSSLSTPDLVHLRNSLLEFFVLALLIRMPFILSMAQVSRGYSSRSMRRIPQEAWTHLTFPWQIVLIDSASIERDQQVRTAISVLDRKSRL